MSGDVSLEKGLLLLIMNLVGVWLALLRLNQERPNLPFLI